MKFSKLVLAALVILVLGSVGFLYYQSHRVQPKQAAEPSVTPKAASVKVDTAPTTQTGYMVITQWGVKMPTGGNTLVYTLRGNIVSIRTAKLDQLSGDCRSNTVDIARGLADDIYPTETPSNETFKAAYADNLKQGDFAKKIGDYYFLAPGYGGAVCVDSTTESSERNKVSELIKGLVAE